LHDLDQQKDDGKDFYMLDASAVAPAQEHDKQDSVTVQICEQC
jgi:hypothetical protein